METGNQKKWYNNKGLIILLFFILPPLGIYAMLKYNTKVWKKVIYTVLALIPSFLMFLTLMYIIIPEKEFEKLKIEKAEKERLNSLKKDSLNKINSENKPLTKKILIPENDIKKLNKKWSDSIVKSWKGKFIISSNLITNNTIELELSKEATKSFYSNKRDNLSMYQSSYNKAFKNKFNRENKNIKIDFIPNMEFSKKFNTSDWGHPVLINKGIQIYTGNKFYKEYLGALECKQKDPTDGLLYYIVSKTNGDRIKIVNYQFRNYWIKQQDSKKYIGRGIPTCY